MISNSLISYGYEKEIDEDIKKLKTDQPLNNKNIDASLIKTTDKKLFKEFQQFKKDLKYKEEAYNLAESRINYFTKIYKFKYNKINIKNQKTRWGSCSKKGNLNFNYKIALLPSLISDYLIAHELCHLKELNHSKRFWKLVEKTIPNYRSIRGELKKAWERL